MKKSLFINLEFFRKIWHTLDFRVLKKYPYAFPLYEALVTADKNYYYSLFYTLTEEDRLQSAARVRAIMKAHLYNDRVVDACERVSKLPLYKAGETYARFTKVNDNHGQFSQRIFKEAQKLNVETVHKEYGFGPVFPMIFDASSDECTVIMHTAGNLIRYKEIVYDVAAQNQLLATKGGFAQNIVFMWDHEIPENLVEDFLKEWKVTSILYKLVGCRGGYPCTDALTHCYIRPAEVRAYDIVKQILVKNPQVSIQNFADISAKLGWRHAS